MPAVTHHQHPGACSSGRASTRRITAVLVSTLIYREYTWGQFIETIKEATKSTATIFVDRYCVFDVLHVFDCHKSAASDTGDCSGLQLLGDPKLVVNNGALILIFLGLALLDGVSYYADCMLR